MKCNKFLEITSKCYGKEVDTKPADAASNNLKKKWAISNLGLKKIISRVRIESKKLGN